MPPRSDATLRSLARRTIRAIVPRKEVPTTGRAISVDLHAQTAIVRVAGSTSQATMQIVSRELADSLRLRVKARETPTVQIDRGVIIGFVAGTPVGRRKAGRLGFEVGPLEAVGDDEIVTATEDSLPSPFWASMEEQATGPSVTTGPRRLEITWIPVTKGGVIAYRVRIVDGAGQERFYTAAGNSSGLTVTGLPEGLTTVQVQAIGADGAEGAWGEVIQVQVLAPTMPLGAPILSSTFRQVLIVIPTAVPGTDEVTLMSGWQVEIISSAATAADIIDLTPETLRTVVTGEPGETLTVRYRYINGRGRASGWSDSASITVAALALEVADLAGLEQVVVTSSNPVRTAGQLGTMINGDHATTSFTTTAEEIITFSWPLAVRIAGVALYSIAASSPAWRLEYLNIVNEWRTLGSNSFTDHTLLGSLEGRLLREYTGQNAPPYVQEALQSSGSLYFKEWRFGDNNATAASRKPKAVTAQSVRLVLPAGFAVSEVRILTYEAAHMLVARRLYLSEGAQIASGTGSSSFEITPEAITGYAVGAEVGRISAADGSLWWKKGGFGGTSATPILKLNDDGTVQLGTGLNPLLITANGIEKSNGFLSLRSDSGLQLRRGEAPGTISWVNASLANVALVSSIRDAGENDFSISSIHEGTGEGSNISLNTSTASSATRILLRGSTKDMLFRSNETLQFSVDSTGSGYLRSRLGVGVVTDLAYGLRVEGDSQLRGDVVIGPVALDVSGGGNCLDIDGTTIRLRTFRTITSSGAAGRVGEICWNDTYLFVHQSSGWRRIALGAAF